MLSRYPRATARASPPRGWTGSLVRLEIGAHRIFAQALAGIGSPQTAGHTKTDVVAPTRQPRRGAETSPNRDTSILVVMPTIWIRMACGFLDASVETRRAHAAMSLTPRRSA